MKAAVVVILVVGFAFGGVAYADLEEGTYAPDIEAREWLNTDEPVSLKELRGMVVILFFWVSWHEGGERIIPLMNLVNSKVGRSWGVYSMAVTDSDRVRVEDMIKEQKVFFPVALESEAYKEYEISSFPRVVVIDPNGKIQWTGWPGRGGDEVYKATLDVIEETPPTKTHPEDAIVVKENLRAARRAMREDEILEAYEAARDAVGMALTGDALKTQCEDVLDLIEALGRDRLALAVRAADEKRFEEAVELLRGVYHDFPRMDVARAARRKLESLERKYDEVKRVLQLHDERADAERLLAKALEDLRSRPPLLGEAYDKLEKVVSDYPDTDGARKAQTVLDRMNKNDGIMGYVRDHQAAPECEMLLAQARAFEHTQRPNKAKQIYRRIMSEYADTIYADTAAERLAQVP